MANYPYTNGSGDGFFIWLLRLAFGALFLTIIVVLILLKLGFFRAEVQLNLAVPDGVNPRQFTMEVISHDPNEDYRVDTDKVDKEGVSRIRMEMGLNSAYLIYDDVKLSLSGDTLIGDIAATVNLDYDLVREQLCHMVLVDLKNMEEEPVPVGELTVADDSGTAVEWMQVDESRIVLVIPEEWTGKTVTISVQGYEPLDIPVTGKDRLTGVDIRLKTAD